MKTIHRLLGTALATGMLASCSGGSVQQADYQVIPLPQQIEEAQEPGFRLSESTQIVYPEGNEQMQKTPRSWPVISAR